MPRPLHTTVLGHWQRLPLQQYDLGLEVEVDPANSWRQSTLHSPPIKAGTHTWEVECHISVSATGSEFFQSHKW